MGVSDYFANSFAEARQKFLQAARAAGARLSAHVLPGQRGPGGEELATDVATLGPDDAQQALLLISGTHGVEGFCGAGCQVGFFIDQLQTALPAGTRCVLVHAINPYGFANLRRVNEDNIDLNRNFHDFTRPLPSSAAYEEVHEWLVPAEWAGPKRQAADLAIQQYVGQRGPQAFQAAVTAGQYTRPTGMFYGGTRPAWSNVTFRQILAEQLPGSVKKLAALDIHTGLGPTGYGEPIHIGPAGEELERARRWLGPEVTSPAVGGAASARVAGALLEAVNALPLPANPLPANPLPAEKVCIALEFGTRPMPEVLTALRADHWLHAAGSAPPSAPPAVREEIKRFLTAAFYPPAPAWKAAVYGRAADLITRIGRALAG